MRCPGIDYVPITAHPHKCFIPYLIANQEDNVADNETPRGGERVIVSRVLLLPIHVLAHLGHNIDLSVILASSKTFQWTN